jgi:hypothetical protein
MQICSHVALFLQHKGFDLALHFVSLLMPRPCLVLGVLLPQLHNCQHVTFARVVLGFQVSNESWIVRQEPGYTREFEKKKLLSFTCSSKQERTLPRYIKNMGDFG